MEQFLILLSPSRPDMPAAPTPEEMATVGAHFVYLQERLASGTLVLAGRTTEPPYQGVAVIEAVSRDDAERIMSEDPAVAAGVFRAELRPFGIALLRGAGAPDASN